MFIQQKEEPSPFVQSALKQLDPKETHNPKPVKGPQRKNAEEERKAKRETAAKAFIQRGNSSHAKVT